jgi:hypothetical protein
VSKSLDCLDDVDGTGANADFLGGFGEKDSHTLANPAWTRRWTGQPGPVDDGRPPAYPPLGP